MRGFSSGVFRSVFVGLEPAELKEEVKPGKGAVVCEKQRFNLA